MQTHSTPIEPHALGERIAALRRGHGWTQRRLAEAAGVSNGYIALLELGRLSSPGKFRLDAIARALSLRTSDSLLSGTPEATPEQASAPPRVASSYAAEAYATNSHTGPPLGSTRDRPRRPVGSGVSPGQVEPERISVPNVAGTLEQVRTLGARQLPVFRWGSCGDPRDRESPPDPDRLEYPPPGRETLIGASGFGVVVKGESMSGRGIHDGDVVWVNPERPYALGKVVLALASDVGGEGGEGGMVVKTYARTEVGECLVSETESGRSPLVCREFKVIGPVVGITSWRLPA